MPVRPGRLLPSVIVGALAVGALTLGAGTASADDTITRSECEARGGQISGLLSGLLCTVDGTVYTLLGGDSSAAPRSAAPAETPASGAAPANGGGLVGGAVDAVGGVVGGLTGATGSSGGGTQSEGTPAGSDAESESGPANDASTDPASATRGGPATAGAPAASGLPAPDVRGAAAPAAAPGGLLTGVPTLAFGRPNPGLFAPLGSPLRTLTGVAPGSPVTTTSDVQAMAFDDLPGGLGTPAVTGVVILSVLGAFALRHRIFRRARTSGSTDS